MNELTSLIHFDIGNNLIASQIIFMKQVSQASLLHQKLLFKHPFQLHSL